jgi:3-hydroxymyristoyl/3-hydroxydecanoyl-(acyl carrier protein) dehydratase
VAEHRARSRIPADHPCLAGHFPGNPVVPAVVLLDLMAHALREALGGSARVTALPAAKFLRPLRPEQDFEIVLQIDASRGSARFDIHGSEGPLAQGRVDYAP